MKYSGQAVCLALAAITATFLMPFAFADDAPQVKPPKRFNWDHRPLKCFAADVPQNNPMCAEAPNWTDWASTVSQVQGLFTEPDFELVARAERELGFTDQRFSTNDPTRTSGEYYFDAWYWALNIMFQQQPTRYADTLEKWKAASGGEGHVVLAEALLLAGEGWEARGSGYANTVPKEAWAIYVRRLEEAASVLDSAPPRLKKTGSWHALKLSLAYQLGAEKGTNAPEFRKAVAAWPYYKRLYTTAINFSMPAWGGNFNDVEAVARYAYDQTKATSGATWYAALYTETFAFNGKYGLRDTKVNWTLMKRGFGDALNNQEFGDRLLFSFARTACQMLDRGEAKRLYDLIDALPEPKRPKNTTTDPCRAFANGAAMDGAMLESPASHPIS